jgi:peptidoglycan-associated lipoprotein
LQSQAERRVEVEGHCDERGTSEYNLALGARRARAVKDAMVGMGISADRMSTVSYGEELPLCKESTESCWATNRRSHLTDLSR